MFDPLKRALLSLRGASGHVRAAAPDPDITDWASERGFEVDPSSKLPALCASWPSGTWRLAVSHSKSPYIRGSEVRGSADLNLGNNASVILIGRKLRDQLERQTFAKATSDLHTGLQEGIPEELLWLASCEEVGWEGPPDEFWQDWAVLASRRTYARAWVDAPLQDMVMDWAAADDNVIQPLILVLQNGQVALRAQHTSVESLQRAALIFDQACRSAQELFVSSTANSH